MYCMFLITANNQHTQVETDAALQGTSRLIQQDSEQVYIPSEPGRSRHRCCSPEMTPSRTVCWAGRGCRRCWTSPPRTSSGGCCTAEWSARPWPAPPPDPSSAGSPEVYYQSSLWRKQTNIIATELEWRKKSHFGVRSCKSLMSFSIHSFQFRNFRKKENLPDSMTSVFNEGAKKERQSVPGCIKLSKILR